MIESIFFHPWVWIIPIVLVVLVLFIVLDIAFGGSDGIFAFLSGFAFLVVSVIYFGFMLPPYDVSYYQTYRITGEVTQVESAFSGDEGTMSQVFIAKVDGIDAFIKSDDQRFRTVSAGDEVNLVCGKGFAYFQEPWYNCSFGGN